MAKQFHRAARRPASAHDTVLEISVCASRRAAQRLMAAIAAGDQRFSIMNRDGSVSIGATLSIDGPVAREEFLCGGGAVIVDWERGTIERNQRRTELSRTELKLMACLLEHRGAPVPRERLTAAVWPGGSSSAEVRDNALAVYVCYLRRKLRYIGLGEHLRTVRRAGYALTL